MPDITHIGQLKPDPRNARKHNPRNVGTIVNSLHEVGAARSIVIDEHDVVLAGNGVIEGAAQAGIERVQVVDADGETIIAVRRRGLSPEQKTRLALYDNRASELAEWDTDVLASLSETDALDGLFSGDELDALLASLDKPTGAGGDDFDTTPDEGQTRVQYGDLWQLGDHRLLCGDSTQQEDVQRLMGGERAALLWTDPPYHVGKDFGAYDEGDVWDAEFQEAWLELALPVLVDTAQRYICFAQARSTDAILAYKPNRLLVWCKPFALMRSNTWDWAYEFVAWCYDTDKPDYFKKPNGTASFDWQEIASVIHGHEGRYHITQKPLGLSTLHIGASCPSGALVYDPFLGSGTTLIAAERLGRKCYGLEIEPKYCDVILRRWEAETGREAVRVDGRT